MRIKNDNPFVNEKRNYLKEKEKTTASEKEKAITLIALVITILFCYDEQIKFSNNNSFLPITNLSFSNI